MENKTVLIVGKNEEAIKILFGELSREYNVLVVANELEAFDLLKKDNKICLLFLFIRNIDDIDKAGLEKLKLDESTKKIPIVTIYSELNETDFDTLFQMGVTDVINVNDQETVISSRISKVLELNELNNIIDIVKLDELTGLYNETYFQIKAEEIIRDNPDKDYDIFWVDINNYGYMKKLFSIDECEKMLVLISDIGKQFLKKHAGIAARVKTQCFVALIEKVDENELNQILEDFKNDIIMEEENYGITMNLTINHAVKGVGVKELCKQANYASENLKKAGKTFGYYDEGIKERLFNIREITESMHRAIREKEFIIYYQPIMGLDGANVLAAEALVRWQNPDKGLLLPKDFLPIFENNGFVTTLDLYVMDTVCRQIRTWINDGIPVVPVSINISTIDIYLPGLKDTLLDIIKLHALTPAHVRLELAESSYVKDSTRLIEVMNELTSAGFSITLDGFGSGNYSINVLNDLPIEYLKVDMAYMQKNSSFRDIQNILSYTLSLAKWVGLTVIAECVENEEQVHFLKALGCEMVQGFYYYSPMPVNEFEEKLKGIDINTSIFVREVNSMEVVDFEQLLNASSLFNQIFESNIAIFCLLELDGDRLFVSKGNKRFRQRFNLTGEDVYLKLNDILNNQVLDHNETLLEKLKEVQINGVGEESMPINIKDTRDGHLLTAYATFKLINKVNNPIYICSLERVKNLSEDADSDEFKESNFDFLTGIYNRRGFERIVDNELKNHRFGMDAFCILDVDDFKEINDKMGHLYGDQVLRRISERIEESVRAHDLVGRYGGDEIMILIKEVPNMNFILEKERRICNDVAKIKFEGTDLKVSCSIGACAVVDNSKSFKEILERADKALYKAKNSGKNNCYIYIDDNNITNDKIKVDS